MEHCYADVNGVRLHYMKAGAGPLILFLHGFPEFWYEWRRQLPEFATDHFVVAPDMRGYNLSSKPAEVEQYAMPHLVEDVRSLAEHLGYGKFVLVGHDWGGAVAWAFAIQHPGSLEKLVIVNAPHPGVFSKLLRENPAQQQASQYMVEFRNPGIDAWFAADNFAALRLAMLGTGLREGVFTAEEWKDYRSAWSQPGAVTGALNYYRAMPSGRETGNYAVDPAQLKVAVPTLVLWGERDPALTIYNVEGLSEYVPNLTVKRFPTGSHWVIHEQPEAINNAIREFVRGT